MGKRSREEVEEAREEEEGQGEVQNFYPPPKRSQVDLEEQSTGGFSVETALDGNDGEFPTFGENLFPDGFARQTDEEQTVEEFGNIEKNHAFASDSNTFHNNHEMIYQ